MQNKCQQINGFEFNISSRYFHIWTGLNLIFIAIYIRTKITRWCLILGMNFNVCFRFTSLKIEVLHKYFMVLWRTNAQAIVSFQVHAVPSSKTNWVVEHIGLWMKLKIAEENKKEQEQQNKTSNKYLSADLNIQTATMLFKWLKGIMNNTANLENNIFKLLSPRNLLLRIRFVVKFHTKNTIYQNYEL